MDFVRRGLKRGRVLVVDDEHIIADTLSLILTQAGYETSTAYSGEQAIELAPTFRPHVVVSDIKMPGIDGVESSAIITETLPNCSVLLVSGHVTTAVLENHKVQELGFRILYKPVPPAILLNEVAEIFRLRTQRPITIVNVDDAEISRYTITHLLQHSGFTVKEAATGTEALHLARTKPDLILLDIHLPDMTGFDVCRALKACPETAHIPIVHLTNTCRDDASRQLALQLGANEYLTQPVEPEPFLELLRTLAVPNPTADPN